LVAFLQRQGALLKLRRERSSRPIVLYRVAGIVAIDTTANRDLAVAVGTGEIEAQADFVNSRAKAIAQHAIEGIETFAAPAAVQINRQVHGVNKMRVNKKARITQGAGAPRARPSSVLLGALVQFDGTRGSCE
jgi:hypothetical protein